MDQKHPKPRLVFFQFQYDDRLPSFLLTHKNEHVRCLSQCFDVTVVSENCDYGQVCDRYAPDLALFESGVNHATCKRLEITGTRSNRGVPKLGLHHGDGFCNARAGFLSDMDLWGIDTFFSIATTAPEHMPEIADQLFVWPVFVDADIYHDYGAWKSIPVLFTGNRNQFYPWRQQLLRVVSERYPAMICPHPGYGPQSRAARVLVGEEYARTLNASWFVPACGTVAKEAVRKHFEVPAAKACLIAEESAALRAAGFVDMRNCVFADARTVLEKLEWLFDNPAILEAIIDAGHELAHSRHTMRSRDQIFQWYTLHRQLAAGQKIIQTNPFEPLSIVPAGCGRSSAHIVSEALHLALLKRGDEHLWRGRYDEAQRCYLECLGYMRWLPEAKLRLALCSLYQGRATAALSCVDEPLQFVLHTYRAADPDPVEWAYFIITLLCMGRVAEAQRHAGEFLQLNHPELDRARWATTLVACDGSATLPPADNNGKRRRSIHQLPERGLNDWVSRLCAMFAASGQLKMAEMLKSRVLSRPAFGPGTSDRKSTAGECRVGRKGSRQMTRALPYQGKGLLVRSIMNRVRRAIAQSLHRLEDKYGYFLPYGLSEARRDEFFRVLQTVARDEEIKTAVMIGAEPGKYSTEAFLAGTLENRCKPQIFCIRCLSGQSLFSKQKRHRDHPVQWYELSCRPDRIQDCLEESLRMIRDKAAAEKFDLIVVDAAELGQAGMDLTLTVCGATAVILEDLASVASYAVYSALRDDPGYVLVCHGPGTQSGYAIFRKATCREEPCGPAGAVLRTDASDVEVPDAAR